MTVAELASQVEVALRANPATEPVASQVAALIVAADTLHSADQAHRSAIVAALADQAGDGDVSPATDAVVQAALSDKVLAANVARSTVEALRTALGT